MKKVKEILGCAALELMLVGSILLLVWLNGVWNEPIEARAEELTEEHVNEYAEILENATEEDFEALEEVVYWESVRAGCSYEVSKAVAETVLNRVLTKGYPDTIYKVCHQRKQFVCKPIPNGLKETTYEAMSDVVEGCVDYGREILPGTDYIFFATKKQSFAKDHVWVGETKNGKPVKGTGHYYGKAK